MRSQAFSQGMRCRWAILALLVLAAGCVQVPTTPIAPGKPAIPGARYEPVTAQDAATVAELRASPPPAEPEISNGGTPAGDETLLNARGYVRIGNGYVMPQAGDARAWALKQGQQVGADKVLMYVPDEKAGAGATQAAFYVRYRLPFGATFRSLTADEQHTLGSGGVQLGEIVGGTPASEANLRRGDFVTRLNGKPFADRAAFQQLLRENMGKRVTLTINRNGVTIERLVRLGTAVHPQSEAAK